jgi:YYY domain-containing protein
MELTPVIIWWLVVFIFGLIGWPMAFSLLRFLPDRGFVFARPVGLLLSGYLLWLGASFRLLQNNPGGIIVAMVIVAVSGALWHRQQASRGESPSLRAWLKQEWRYVAAVELLFSLVFALWVYYKAHNPNLETAGGEKWMEIAFINGILRSQYFPPQDPWLSGFGISYYYFGYVLMAMITQLTGIVSTTAFNLYIPTLLAMTLTGAFGLGANLVQLARRQESITPDHLFRLPLIATGLVSALLVGVMGNLIGVLEVLHKKGWLPAAFWHWLDIRDLNLPPPGLSDSFIPDRFMWWWRGSRVLTDYTPSGSEQEVIDEFPFFSFLLGDVHPHVLALPFVLLVVGLALNLLANPTPPPRPITPEPKPNIIDKSLKILQNSGRQLTQAAGGRLALGLYALIIGGLSFLNTWDFPIYLSVVALALLVWLAHHARHWSDALLPGAIGAVTLAVAGLLFYLPFYATFQSQAKGILPNLWNPTRLPQFLVFFGPFLVAGVAMLLLFSIKDSRWKGLLGWALPLTTLAPAIALAGVMGLLIVAATTSLPVGPAEYLQGVANNPEVQAVIGGGTIAALIKASFWRRLANPWTFLLLGALLGWGLALLIGLSRPAFQEERSSESPPAPQRGEQKNKFPPSGGSGGPPRLVEQFALILLVVGLALPMVVEFVYLRDNFGIRMNTIFKFYFQAWVLLALASAFALYYVAHHLRPVLKSIWLAAMAVLLAGGLVYPVLATLNRANNFQDAPTLNGIAWINQHHPGDYAAIEWLRRHAPDHAVILEAPGNSYAAYQYTARFSALTGLPTLLGWGGHESQWRGNYDEPARREPDIEALYNTSNYRQALALLDKYGIDYVIIGSLERERYSPQGLNKFSDFMKPVFQQDEVVIYQR